MPPPIPLHQLPAKTAATAYPPLGQKASLDDLEEALGEDPKQRTLRLRELFAVFDETAGKTGSVDRAALEAGFDSLSIPNHHKYARELLEVADSNHDGRLDFSEFEAYMNQKELELLELFREVDVERDGKLFLWEIKAALQKAGVTISPGEVNNFMRQVDANHDGSISFAEWRDFFLLFPHRVNVRALYGYWHDIAQVDIGDAPVVPSDCSNARGKGRTQDSWKYLFAGAVAGAVSRTATAPLDRLKVLLQVQRQIAPAALSTELGGAATLATVRGSGMAAGLAHIYKEGGVQGFFRGNGINVLKVAPESAIKFAAFEMLKPILCRYFTSSLPKQGEAPRISTAGRVVSGGLAGMIAQTAIYPLEVVKTRIQTAPSSVPRPTLLRCAAEVYSSAGLRGFFRGLGASLAGVFPYAGLDLAVYETLKAQVEKSTWAESGTLTQLGCGTASGALGATAVYPLQVVRTRLQASLRGDPHGYTGMVDCFTKILNEEGPRAFYKGLAPNLLKVVPAASITYVVYEGCKKQLDIG
ncbi:calcium-binding mitochondrial carrier protein [Klebsormidium nitens]|uniref:Calcium-binding mitochondrial carrier protein n=1 Tax=Klebsormidium nitens TaxID=105231 RepID=A0A1Y1IMI8_KLENI|nr:calcium-binding mitochondrial carrier protein [Klebsormidium nitens]|eukprot:GAQ89807.1 calcium-binding mitochondrial carrier protein [Klebsormidium nitens]